MDIAYLTIVMPIVMVPSVRAAIPIESEAFVVGTSMLRYSIMDKVCLVKISFRSSRSAACISVINVHVMPRVIQRIHCGPVPSRHSDECLVQWLQQKLSHKVRLLNDLEADVCCGNRMGKRTDRDPVYPGLGNLAHIGKSDIA